MSFRVRMGDDHGLGSAANVQHPAAILSFVAAFFLVRFRYKEASHEEMKIESIENPEASKEKDPKEESALNKIFTTNPHLEAVGPLGRWGQPPTHLLDRCHTLAMTLALLGFILAMIGIVCLVWVNLPLSSSIASMALLGLCCGLSFVAIFACFLNFKTSRPTFPL